MDTNDGLIYFEIFDIIKSGIVDWSRVTKYFFGLLVHRYTNICSQKLFFNYFRRSQFSSMDAKAELQKLENCNYVVELAQECELVIVGLQGNDIR